MTEVTSQVLAPLYPVAVAEVLETMFFAAAEPSSNVAYPLAGEWLTVVVDFTGSPSGSTWIWLENETARALACDFLGLEPEDVSDECVRQTACEFGNMICGSIVSRVESNSSFTLASPRLESGQSYGGPPPMGFQLDRGQLAVACTLLPC